jgi:Sulfotransferase domain
MASRPPNFLFIGPDKAGSTWLYEALRTHPQVCLSQVKELFFFDRFYGKGWRWYLKFFEHAGEEHRIVGEICHDYLFSRVACRRIARDLPAVKLMVCLREPAQRAFSEYLYLTKLGLLSCDFDAALGKEKGLVEHGCYARHLSSYLEYFSREQIYVAVFDDLVAEPQRFFDRLCDFLGLSNCTLSPDVQRTILPAAKPRLPYFARGARSIAWGARRLGLPGVVGQVKESALLGRLLYQPYIRGEKPEISHGTREYLRGVFSSELRRLDGLLETNLCHRWGYASREVPTRLEAVASPK